ncbi:MAG: LysR family transcriptional regulator [Pseudomonadota bacterium]
MNDWSEFKTAMIVAKLGSISAAAAALGVHRATISRHIDVAEQEMSAVLFVRHPRGVELTEAGAEMLKVTQKVQDIFEELKGSSRIIQGKHTGELIVTSLIGLLPLLMPTVTAFNEKFPEVLVHLVSGEELLRLEYGEAQIALRGGPKPTNPDYVVRKFRPVEFGAYIHRNTLFKFETSTGFQDWRELPFIGPSKPNIHQPFAKWMREDHPDAKVTTFVDAQEAILPAVLGGAGIGFLPRHIGNQSEELIDLDPLNQSRTIPLWLINHRDLNKTPKVQDFVQMLLSSAEGQT